ncbi:glycosyltransferase family 4 protein [Herpetosiphon gulosus]|uniref:D-inositol-3-phosphate glycosyltransferase n=1 Tax=Herpetosiphon gulosus TaxID=1973496 RepID=A0ABP9WUT0_9CHLR
MMRILLLTAEYLPQPGGVGDYTAKLAEALTALGCQVCVLTAGEGAEQTEPWLVWRRVRGWGRKLHQDVRNAAKQFEADIVHIQYQTGAYEMKPAVNLLPAALSVPSVVTLHDLRMPYLAPKVAPLRRYVTRLLIENAHAVVVTNAEDESRLAGDAPSSNPDIYTLTQPLEPPAHLIPIGANIEVAPLANREQLRQQLGANPDTLLLGYFGLLNSTKGVHTIVESLQYLPATTRLVIIGGGIGTPEDEMYAEQLRATISRLGLDQRIHWTGYLGASEVSRTLQALDCAALPFSDGASYRRGSLLAMLAHGVPTITTPPHVPIDPSLRHERDVLLVEPDDAINLALAVEQIAANPELRQQLSQAGQHIACSFRWETIAQLHATLYQQLLDAQQTKQEQDEGSGFSG